MSNIKKAFQPIIELLEANVNVKVATILDKAIALTEAKTGGGGRASNTIVKDGKDNVTHIFCYYHKRWEDVKLVEYGKKASSPTGLSNMCKEGTSAWSKQQAEAKKAKEQLLIDVTKQEVKPTEIPALMDAIEKARKAVVGRKENPGTEDMPGTEKTSESKDKLAAK